jgi:hypothetical protein
MPQTLFSASRGSCLLAPQGALTLVEQFDVEVHVVEGKADEAANTGSGDA